MAKYWTPKDYTPFFLMDEPTHTESEIRAEYTRLRDITVKRAARLEKKGLTSQAAFLRQTMPKLKDIKSSQEVAKRLAQGSANIQTKAYSLKGLKELQKLLSDETGEFVPLGDVLPFSEYMQSWRLSAFSRTLVPSGTATELYNEDYQEIGGNFADFYALYKAGV